MDCKAWAPEAPERIGVYHAYLRGYNRDVRAHKMFLVASGGLEKACDGFCNLVVDVGAKWTAREVAISEEAWWLRRGCSRARCRLLQGLAEAFHVKVPHVQDIHAHEACTVCIPTVDTVEHDIACSGPHVAVFNGCCDTTRPFNGMLVRMHASEGYWLVRGAKRGSCAESTFGSTFGDEARCGAFPTSQPPLPPRGHDGVAVGVDPCVVGPGAGAGPGRVMFFDEAFFRTLEQMGWDRNNGYIELMPIVVGVPGVFV